MIIRGGLFRMYTWQHVVLYVISVQNSEYTGAADKAVYYHYQCIIMTLNMINSPD